MHRTSSTSADSPLDDPKSSEAKLRVTTKSEVFSLPANECSGPWEGYPQCESKMAVSIYNIMFA